jgi:hypothetical protein
VRELGQADRAPTREAVLGADPDHERLVQEVLAAQPRVLPPGRGRILEEHGDVQAAVAHHEAMLSPIASIEALAAQRRQLNGWGPAEQDDRADGYVVSAPRSSRAARAVFSAVIPSFSRTRAPGALAPKRSIATTRSTQRSHP